MNANNVRGNPGDKFYKCYHGQCKTLTITKAIGNLSGEIQIGKHSQRIHKRERDLSKHKQKLDELLLEKNNE